MLDDSLFAFCLCVYYSFVQKLPTMLECKEFGMTGLSEHIAKLLHNTGSNNVDNTDHSRIHV